MFFKKRKRNNCDCSVIRFDKEEKELNDKEDFKTFKCPFCGEPAGFYEKSCSMCGAELVDFIPPTQPSDSQG